MLEGENAIRSVTVMQRRRTEDVGPGQLLLGGHCYIYWPENVHPDAVSMKQNYYSEKMLESRFLEVRVPRLSGVLQLWV